MNEPVIIPQLGKIWGRDAIYLTNIEFMGTRTVKLTGDFNGTLCENVKNDVDVSYKLTFKGILEFRSVELDFFDHSHYSSSFERVIDSSKLKAFSNGSQAFKLSDTHKHYIFHTYDDVIEVVANDFEIELEFPS